MGHRFADLMFSSAVKAVQTEQNSRPIYQRQESTPAHHQSLTDKETVFLSQRDSFYIASVSPDGWPYVQHRGGPRGFLKVLDERHIGFADYRGNRQYISTGNLRANNRVALILVDYPNRRRLKMLGFATELGLDDLNLDEPGTESAPPCHSLIDQDYPAQVERAFVIRVEAFDWNCPQHITPRYDASSPPL